MSAGSASTVASSFHSRPHSPAYHNHFHNHHHHHAHHSSSHSASSTSHTSHPVHRSSGFKRSVGPSSSLVASTKGQSQMKSPEKREKEKDRRKERQHNVTNSLERREAEQDQAGFDGTAGESFDVAVTRRRECAEGPEATARPPRTPSLSLKGKHHHPRASCSPSRNSRSPDRPPNAVLPQTPPFPLRSSGSPQRNSHFSYPNSKSTLSPPTVQASDSALLDPRHVESDGTRKRDHCEVDRGSSSVSPGEGPKIEPSRSNGTAQARQPGRLPDRPRSEPGPSQERVPASSTFGSKSDSHLPTHENGRLERSRPPPPPYGQPPLDGSMHRSFAPPRRMYAFNATSAEEEARRAMLVDACEGLSSLCSQWHASEYNKLKFGERGAPMHYCPLTIAAPQHVHSVMMAQAMFEQEVYATEDAYGNDSLASSTASESSFATSRTSQRDGALTSNGESRLFETVTEPDGRPGAPRGAVDHPTDKQSSRSMDGSWVKDVDPSGPNEEETTRQPNTEAQRHNPTNQTPLRVLLPQSIEQEEGYEGMAVKSVEKDEIEFKNGQHLDMPKDAAVGQTRDEKIQMELKQAMEDEMRGNPTGTSVQSMAGGHKQSEQDSRRSGPRTSDTHPINVSMLVPVDTMPMLVNHLATTCDLSSKSHGKPLLFPASDEVWQSTVMANQIGGNAPIPITAIPQPQINLGIGNLLLSSCPGKKVRLEGPVRGRATICRDLKLDLQRIKEMGVGCIVCCLDDNELRFLGAPWEEYRARAVELGLHIMRIPMPEGLTPSSLTTFDGHVEKVIRNFTLKGIHVLAHCRAGVGRAGLTACAWAIKMGIAGSLPDLELQLSQLIEQEQDVEAICENARVMSTVERVICLIRRRRSIKAIETFEQVNFLASYVAWLRRESGMAFASESQ